MPQSELPEDTNTRTGKGGDASALEAAPPEAQPGSRGMEQGVDGTRLAEASTDGQGASHGEPRKPSTPDLDLVREEGSAGGEGRGANLQNTEIIGAGPGAGEPTAPPGVNPEEQQIRPSQQQQQRQQQGTSREANVLNLVPQVTARAVKIPAGEATAIATAPPATATVQTAAAGAEQREPRELEESGGSLEGDSVHSRWSLPDNRGIGGIGAAGGLHEQRAVWAGGQEDDDSVATAEQAASSVESEGGGRGEGVKSPSRSRVESYDLEQEPVRVRAASLKRSGTTRKYINYTTSCTLPPIHSEGGFKTLMTT